MATKIRTNPRKSPSQSRSRETVEVILEAGARILVKDGYDRASTNRVAEEAGVSIGSLYQYFPSKEALVGTLVERQLEEDRNLVVEQLLSFRDKPIRERIKAIISALLKAFSTNSKLRKVLHDEVPRVGRLQRLQDIKEDIGKLLIENIGLNPEQVRVNHVDLAVFILVNAVESTLYSAVYSREGYSQKALEEELTDLIMRYLLVDGDESVK